MVPKAACGALIVCLLLLPGKAKGETALEALYRAAKAEGEVMVWSPNEYVRDIQVPGFKKAFPGIEVNFFEIRPSDYVARALAEIRQGIISFDVGTGRYAALKPLVDRDLVQAYSDWAETFTNLSPKAVSRDGRFLVNGDLLYVISYNTGLVKPAEAPKSWDELLEPKWKGKIVVEARANAFAYLGLKWGEEKMVQYVKRLKEQAGSFVKGGTTTAQQLAAGAGHLAVGAYAYKILQMKRDGAPVDYAKAVSPVGAAGQNLYVLGRAKHPNAAKLLVGWLASERGQRLINDQALMGSMVPGNSYIAMREAERHGVEIIREDLDSFERAKALNVRATKALGVLK